MTRCRLLLIVIAGLDPAIHAVAAVDCRVKPVKPGNDSLFLNWSRRVPSP